MTEGNVIFLLFAWGFSAIATIHFAQSTNQRIRVIQIQIEDLQRRHNNLADNLVTVRRATRNEKRIP